MESIIRIYNEFTQRLRKKGMKGTLIIHILCAFLLCFFTCLIEVFFIEKWKRLIINVNNYRLLYDGNIIITKNMISNDRGNTYKEVSSDILNQIGFLSTVEIILIVITILTTIYLTAHFYYNNRIKEPYGLIKQEVDNICNNDLSFDCKYAIEDEMGDICMGFNKMRIQLMDNQKKLWDTMEDQKQLNRAFAHDIRNPLTVMKGYTQMAIAYGDKKDISQDKLREILYMIDKQVDKMERFTTTMKEISSLEELEINKKNVSFSHIIDTINTNLKGLEKDKLSIEVVCKSELSNTVNIDIHILEEIVDNFISNAIRYVRSKILVSIVEDNNKLYVYVQDDGDGYSSEALEKATRPYYTGDESHMGLGLSICKLLAKKHGGNIELSNGIDGGAIACVYL